MKNASLFFLSLLITCFSCNSEKHSDPAFNLLPQVKEFTQSGLSDLAPKDIKTYLSSDDTPLPVRGELLQDIKAGSNQENSQLIYQVDKDLDIASEGYTLHIETEKIYISGKDEAGLFYAFMTLEQLMQDARDQKSNLPLCTITDYPSLAYRAIHVDQKHHLEKISYYYEMMDRLAAYKVNAIIIEFEDKLEYQRQPRVASPDAISIEEWIKLSNYAKDRNIEISPLIQGLGHASFILKHPEYAVLRDKKNSDWAFNPLDPDTYKVQFDLYLDAMEATPHGKYLHVGGDEVHTNGRGSNKSALELQLIWLDKVCKFAEEHGRVPIFWDDMPLKHAGVIGPTHNVKLTKEEVDKVWEKGDKTLLSFLDQFPKNCIYMRWNYGAPEALGNIRAMEWYIENDLKVMGATAGQTRWDLMPQNQSNQENIKSFAVSSIETKLDGLLLTLWDDASPHFELYWRGIIFFAEYTWAGDVRTNDELKSTYRNREFGTQLSGKKYAFIDKLEYPVSFWGRAFMAKSGRNNLRRFKNPMEEAILNLPDPENKGAWSKEHKDRLEIAANILLECDTVSEIIKNAKSTAIRNPYTLEMYEQVNKIVRHSPKILLSLQAFDEAEGIEAEDAAMKEIRLLKSEFEKSRASLEEVYGQARILNKPDSYILDQDHHTHTANQSINFDWQFYAEILFLEKIDKTYFSNAKE